MFVVVCMGACACRTFVVASNLKIPVVLPVAVISPLPLMARALHRCFPHWLPPSLRVKPSLRRNCKWYVPDLNFGGSSSNVIAAPDLKCVSQASKISSCGFIVSIRESNSLHFSENSKSVFPQPPYMRGVSIFAFPCFLVVSSFDALLVLIAEDPSK